MIQGVDAEVSADLNFYQPPFSDHKQVDYE